MRCRRSHPTQVGGRGCASKSQKLMWSEPRTNSPSGQTAPSLISHTASCLAPGKNIFHFEVLFSPNKKPGGANTSTQSGKQQTQIGPGSGPPAQPRGATAEARTRTRWAVGSRRPASAFTARSCCQSWEHFICALCQLKKLVSNRAGRWKPVRQACGLAQARWAGIRPP